jgi:hypothetical protein
MRKLKEVLRLHSIGISRHRIARSCSISQSTVHEYVSAAKSAGVPFPMPDDWDDTRIEQTLFPLRPAPSVWRKHAEPDWTRADLVEESDLLLEELLMELGVGDLDLVSPTTALGYRGRSGDIREFAAECRADYVVEGRLRRSVAAMEGLAWVIDGQSGLAQRYRRSAGADAAAMAREIAAWVLAESSQPGHGAGQAASRRQARDV